MKNFIFFLVLMFGAVFFANAQPPTPQASPPPQRASNPADESQRIRERQETNRRFDALRGIGEYNAKTIAERAELLNDIKKIYRKPTKEEIKMLSPNPEDLKKYESFLRQPKTGIVKLISDRGCGDNINVVNAVEECVKYSMPGAGASFSFRTENYRVKWLSDITFGENRFQSHGLLMHGILVNIGDVALEQISSQTKAMKFVREFEIAADFDKAKETDRRLVEGIEADGLIYSRRANAAENATYILRSVAFRGNSPRAYQGFVYDEFDFDERKDVTVAFRVIRLDSDSITFIWKELGNQKSPVIKSKDRKSEENISGAKDEAGEN